MRSLLVAIFLVTVVQLCTPQTVHYSGLGFDGEIYASIADPSLFSDIHRTASPWCWRVLSPYLISLLPFETFEAFRINAWLSAVVVLALLGPVLSTFGFSAREVIGGQLLYAGSYYSVKFFLHNPGYLDNHTQIVVLLTMLLLERKRTLLLAPLLTLGVLQKESTLLLAPAVVIALLRLRPLPYVTISSSLVAPTLMLIWVRRSIYTPMSYSSARAAFIAAAGFLNPELWSPYALSLLKSLGLVPFIVALAPQPFIELLRKKPEYRIMAILSAVQILGGVDKGRLLLPLLPILTAGALHSLRILRTHSSSYYRLWLAATVVVHLWIGHHLTSPSPQWEYLSMVPEHYPIHEYGPLWISYGVQLVTWFVISLPLIRSYRLRM